MIHPRVLLGVLLAGGLALAPSYARAEVEGATRGATLDPAAARRSFEQGRALYDAGDYAAAATAFTQAYVLGGPPALLFNLAQAHRRAGECRLAHGYYTRFLLEVTSSSNHAVAAKHRRSLAGCAAEPTGARADAPAPPAPAPSRPIALAAAPLPRPVGRPPSPVTEPAPPRPTEANAAIDRARPLAAAPLLAAAPPLAVAPLAAPPLAVAPLAAAPLAAAPPPLAATSSLAAASLTAAPPLAEHRPAALLSDTPRSPERRSMALRNAGLVTATVGVVLLVTGAALDAPGCPAAGCDDDDESLELRTPLMVGGGALGALGVGLAIWGQVRGQPAPVAVVVTRGGGMVARTWRF
jgi:hypothetical protein